ncbi:MAG: hypothetical protein ACRYHA_06955 [Janthinobacterium lividum]
MGLIAPYMRTADSELVLFNRGAPGSPSAKAAWPVDTPSQTFDSPLTEPDPVMPAATAVRNALLADGASRADGEAPYYLVAHSDGHDQRVRHRVRYNRFFTYGDDIDTLIGKVLEQSRQKHKGVIVSGALMQVRHYAGVVRALNVLRGANETSDPAAHDDDATQVPEKRIGRLYFVACENMFSAADVLADKAFAEMLGTPGQRPIHCVTALVDRICSRMDRCMANGRERLLVTTESYGKLTLHEHGDQTTLAEMLAGSKVTFSKHLETEREIKGWLLNGSHLLIALTAFRETKGDMDLKLNEFIADSTMHRYFAGEIITEMRDGVEAILESDPTYASFRHDVDISAYLDKAAACILSRFAHNEDSVTRILKRFRAPTEDDLLAVQTFVGILLRKIERPLHAYAEKFGVPPKASTEALVNVLRLQASATYANNAPH